MEWSSLSRTRTRNHCRGGWNDRRHHSHALASHAEEDGVTVAITHAHTTHAEEDGMTAAITHTDLQSLPRWMKRSSPSLTRTPNHCRDGMIIATTHTQPPSPPRWMEWSSLSRTRTRNHCRGGWNDRRHHSHALASHAEEDGVTVAITHTHSQPMPRRME
jgi:hypothetical protein